jgi:hypothetical protein
MLADRIERIVNNISIPGFETTPELLHEPLVLARIRVVEEKSPGLFRILSRKRLDVAGTNLGEFPFFRQ